MNKKNFLMLNRNSCNLKFNYLISIVPDRNMLLPMKVMHLKGCHKIVFISYYSDCVKIDSNIMNGRIILDMKMKMTLF